MRGLGLLETVSATNFEGLVTTLFGYIIISLGLVFLHSTAIILRFRRTQKLLGLSYVAVKVALLFIFEIGIFPLVFGWWFDICSLVSFSRFFSRCFLFGSNLTFSFINHLSLFLEQLFLIENLVYDRLLVHRCSFTGSLEWFMSSTLPHLCTY